jgi:hypothetical protein
VWVADLLPNDLAPIVDAMMEQGCQAMKHTLERTGTHQSTSAYRLTGRNARDALILEPPLGYLDVHRRVPGSCRLG